MDDRIVRDRESVDKGSLPRSSVPSQSGDVHETESEPMNITGNTIFIPGATSGIGLALAVALKNAGNTVIVGGRRTELLHEIELEHGIVGIAIDTADAASIADASAEVQRRYPATNVLITMAGIMLPENYRTASFLDVAEATIATNLLGPIRLIAAFSEHLAAQPNATIMTVSSGLAYVPLPATPTYSATKAAIHSLSDALRVQFAEPGIQVIELAPPLVRTALMGSQDNPHGMPLDAFIAEVMGLLEADPEAKQILVQRVHRQRFAVENGTYDEVLASQSQL